MKGPPGWLGAWAMGFPHMAGAKTDQRSGKWPPKHHHKWPQDVVEPHAIHRGMKVHAHACGCDRLEQGTALKPKGDSLDIS